MSRDTSFYYSFLVLPPRKRRAIVAVWDFCRAVDDAVDQVVPESDGGSGSPPRLVREATRAAVRLAHRAGSDLRRHPAHALRVERCSRSCASSICRARSSRR